MSDYLSQLVAQYQNQQQALGPMQMPQVPGLLAEQPQTQPAPADSPYRQVGSSLNEMQRGYMDQNYAGKWDPAYWTPQRFVQRFGDTPVDSTGQAIAQQPLTPPVRPYQGDFRTYGFGGEHQFFGGINGQPYGLTSFTGQAQRSSIGTSQLQQIMEAIRATQQPRYVPQGGDSGGGGE